MAAPDSGSTEAPLRALRDAVEQFTYAATHDLRGPMGQVRTLSALLLKKHAKDLNEDGGILCGHIAAAAERATFLVDALHAYAKAITSVHHPVPVDTRQLFESVRNGLGEQIRSSGAVVTCDALPAVTADAEAISNLFRHLVDNALKFYSAGPPCIHVSSATESGACRFSIRDNGIGIPARFQEEIFKPLRRLNGSQYPGAGIGLAICRHIVESHGGAIWVESDPGEGSVFHFTLPR
jgi:signal transduction histidine kinase